MTEARDSGSVPGLERSLGGGNGRPLQYENSLSTSKKQGYFSVIKKNEMMSFETTWRDLEIIILSEINQTERHIVITHIWNLKI